MNLLKTKAPQAEPALDIAASVRASLAELDFSTDNAELAEIEASLVQIDSAIADARERMQKLGADGEHQMEAGHRAVADALLAGNDPNEASRAATLRGTIEEQREALQGAIRQLADRRRSASDRAAAIRSHVAVQVRDAAAPLVSAIMDDAKRATVQVAECRSNMTAVRSLLSAGDTEVRQLNDMALAAMEARLLPGGFEFRAADWITELHTTMASKGAAYPIRFASSSLREADRPRR